MANQITNGVIGMLERIREPKEVATGSSRLGTMFEAREFFDDCGVSTNNCRN